MRRLGNVWTCRHVDDLLARRPRVAVALAEEQAFLIAKDEVMMVANRLTIATAPAG